MAFARLAEKILTARFGRTVWRDTPNGHFLSVNSYQDKADQAFSKGKPAS